MNIPLIIHWLDRILLVVAHVLGSLVLVAFATGYYLGNRVWPFKPEAPYPDPPKALPVCNLDHIKSYTETVPLALENNFQIFNVVFDEGIVRTFSPFSFLFVLLCSGRY